MFFILAISLRKNTIPKINAQISTIETFERVDWSSYIVISILIAKSKYFMALCTYLPVGIAFSTFPLSLFIRIFSGPSASNVSALILESCLDAAPNLLSSGELESNSCSSFLLISISFSSLVYGAVSSSSSYY